MNTVFYVTLGILFLSCQPREAPLSPCKNVDRATNTCLDGSTVMSNPQPTPTAQGMSSEQLVQVLSALQARSNQPPVTIAPNDTVEDYTLKTEQYWLNVKSDLIKEKDTASPKRYQQIEEELEAVEENLAYYKNIKKDPPSNWGHNVNQVCQAFGGGSCLDVGGNLYNRYMNRQQPLNTGPLGPPAPCPQPPC